MPTRAPRASRRAFLRLAAAGSGALAAALLGACGGQAPTDPLALPTLDPSLPTPPPLRATSRPEAAAPTARPPATAAAEKTTIVLGHWDGLLRPVLAGFEREHPGVEVRFIPADFDTYHRGLRSALTSGEGAPDVAAVGANWLGTLVARGGLLDLAAPPFDGARMAGDMVPGAWQMAYVDGRQIALPWGVHPAAMWYRADLLADVGVEDDPAVLQGRVQSWDDLLVLAREITTAKAERRLFFDARDVFYTAVAQEPYGWLDGVKVLIEERGRRPAQLASRVREEELDAALVSGNAALAVKNGELAGFFGDIGVLPFLTRDLADTSGAWRVLLPPGGPAIFGVTYLALPEQSEHQELAWELATYLAGPTAQNAYLKAGGAIPAHMPAWADPLYDAPVAFLGGQTLYRPLAERARAMPAGTLSEHHRDADDIVGTELSLVVERAKDPVQAMRDAEAAMIRKFEGLVA